MIGRYAVLAGRIEQDLADLARVVERVERAVQAATATSYDRDLLFDAAALNLHDFYGGLERILTHIASGVDESTPAGADWHRELLRQMTIEVPGLRLAIFSTDLAAEIDEYLRFRHVVRHIYAFDLKSDRIEQLARGLPPRFERVRTSIMIFVKHLRDLADQA